ncbi:MAG: hypothetical protein U0168_30465 [Nannocystaceae bacterium]
MRKVAIAALLGVIGCTSDGGGASTGDGASASESASESGTSMTTAGSSDSGAEAGCNGGPACGADEYCYAGGSVCTCEDNFQHCSSESPPAGCTAVPPACTGMQGAALQNCVAEQSCGVFPGVWVDGALDCETEECAGDCDLDPDACIDTSSGGSSTGGGSSTTDGGSSSGGSSTGA